MVVVVFVFVVVVVMVVVMVVFVVGVMMAAVSSMIGYPGGLGMRVYRQRVSLPRVR